MWIPFCPFLMMVKLGFPVRILQLGFCSTMNAPRFLLSRIVCLDS
nr:hypothetical protein Iba_chr02eCG6370 [Ipomoea batatas]